MKHEKKKAACYSSKIMFGEEQAFACAICRREHRIEHLDHCHRTGLTRGSLCSACNTSIGKLGESVEILKRAIRYIEWSKARIEWVQGNSSEYVPIWPIYIGDAKPDEFPEAYLILDREGQDVDFAWFQRALWGEVSVEEVRSIIARAKHELAEKAERIAERKRREREVERRKRAAGMRARRAE